jgi:hypothetical protein
VSNHLNLKVGLGTVQEQAYNLFDARMDDLLDSFLALLPVFDGNAGNKQVCQIVSIASYEIRLRACIAYSFGYCFLEFCSLGIQEGEIFLGKHSHDFGPTDDMEDVTVDRVHISFLDHVPDRHAQQAAQTAVLRQIGKHLHQVHALALAACGD